MTTKLTTAELDEIEALLKEATPNWIYRAYEVCGDVDSDGYVPVFAAPPCGGSKGNRMLMERVFRSNAELAVALKNAAPALLAAARELERVRPVIEVMLAYRKLALQNVERTTRYEEHDRQRRQDICSQNFESAAFHRDAQKVLIAEMTELGHKERDLERAFNTLADELIADMPALFPALEVKS